jgi:signal transduction histidine kinase
MIQPADKLALTEMLLRTADSSECAQKGLEWLGHHRGGRAVLALAIGDPWRVSGVAAIGISTARTGEFSLDLTDRDDPLVASAWNGRVTHFPGGPEQPQTPLQHAPFSSIPLRPHRARAPMGILLVENDGPELDADTLWFADIVSERICALRPRHTGDRGVDRERQLLYSIINAVTDPILLTDAAGHLILGNLRAEQFFTSRPGDSEGRGRAVELNNLLFSSALAGWLIDGGPSPPRDVSLIDPEDGSNRLFELLTSRIAIDRETPVVVSVLRNVSDLAGRARQELEHNYRRLLEAEFQARTERIRLDLLVDSVGDPIILTDRTGDILMTNVPAERFFTASESAGEEAQRRVQDNVAQFSSFVADLMLQGDAADAEQRWRARFVVIEPVTGRAVTMEALAATMGGPRELSGIVTVLHDQTEAIERERLYEELQQVSERLELKAREATAELARQNELLRRQALDLEHSSAAKSQFLANVSHEFRTPLNAILGYSLMLIGGFYGALTDEQLRIVQRIDANSKHMATLINDVLDIERIEAGRMPLQLSQFSIAEVVAEVLEELEGVIAQSPATVHVTIPDDLPRIRSDRQKLKQILINLLSNALKYTPEGAVDILARHDAARGRIALAVRDTGIGIAPDDCARIFEPFHQAKRVVTRPQGGTGLGLAISRRLARMIGGDIGVTSELGTGSEFTVNFPVRVRARAAPYRDQASNRRRSA